MHYYALACDYDGTLARDGRVDPRTIEALEKVKTSGRALLLVTGRLLPDLKETFSRLDLFTYVVAENGALLYHPATSSEYPLGEPPPFAFLQALHERGVTPLDTGQVIASTWHPHETTVLSVIRDMGLELQVIFNKGAVMILPEGINKGSGLSAALQRLQFSRHNVVGVGDAENDHSFLTRCACSVTVANALQALKEQADYTTAAGHGKGVVELIEHLLATDLCDIDQRSQRHMLHLGTRPGGDHVLLPASRSHVLITGTSGSGKSTLTLSLFEQLAEEGYQFCLIDPEGDYETFEEAITLGDAQREPSVGELLQVLEQPDQSAIVNLLGRPLTERPLFSQRLLPNIEELQLRLGHPHWLLFDEAHHLFPPNWNAAPLEGIRRLCSTLFITSHSEHVSQEVLKGIDTVICIGAEACSTLQAFQEAVGDEPLDLSDFGDLQGDEAIVWFRTAHQKLLRMYPMPPKQERHRHRRKYAEGSLGEDISFYFRGREGKLNLRAQNLTIFTQIAQGLDDETWLFHLHQGDYSRWFRQIIKDEELAKDTEVIEHDKHLSPLESRERIRISIEKQYTLPD
ncbi:HAD-IIB family hydrolase [Ktedonospora formicarum]|uniref:Phosphoglycolate phosphatase n=1 Tax=Ktedonospora formicarum TaxID=2778364 RepID=A0A8J3I2X2_9CHLR|nr:HAD-IIB family hydrolase [Ktedonospora formicarum]GHO45728.1 phosphoglycolate phosphatase [Ktedonospora formicarum]